MDINKIRSISIWIFIIPVISINFCLILSQVFYPENSPFALGDAINDPSNPLIIPYVDGGTSISRVVRVYPNNLIFKPAMFITSFLLILYWFFTKKVFIQIIKEHHHLKKMFYCGVISSVCLTIHSIFLGIDFDFNIFKLFRRIILLSFIIFEIIAQTYFVIIVYNFKNKFLNYLNLRILFIKRILITILVILGILIIPFLPFNNFKFLKHALEWNYFIGVNSFYLLSFYMWKKLSFNPSAT